MMARTLDLPRLFLTSFRALRTASCIPDQVLSLRRVRVCATVATDRECEAGMRYHPTGLLAALWLIGAAVPAAYAAETEDAFTPLTAVPFNPVTTPVPGTDGKWHFVYELQLA